MVKLREEFHHPTEDIIYPEIWFEHVAHNRSAADIEFLRSAFALAELAGEGHATFTGVPVIQNALAMADIVDNLQLDVETIAATLLYPCVEYADLAIADIAEQLGANIAKLIHDVKSMQAIRQFYLLSKQSLQSHSQIDNLRKMLLAMVDDIRVVLIKLAERVCTLRQLRHLDTTTQVDIAQETQEIYAPLANRLGIAQIKWELEDLSFRYLQAPIYKEIASQVAMKRSERESYIGKIINSIDEQLKDHSISHYQIDGRAKHIFSIYKKMQRKNIGFDKVFDVIAVRILVKDIESCYAVLSLVHLMWQPIAAEFDDYINHPKPNGYRSLHTAVIGPQNKNVEIQIRTFAMHDEAELGVAAHWIYKEGKQKKSTYNDKIAWLRQIMDWQKEISPEEQANQPDTLTKQLFNDRIYVFTPRSEILDLPAGATPLDFAYLVHTEIGHRCKGAKINDHIVPLTYQLKTGDKIEVLTAKFPNPSRDWLNANLGYVKTSRAKAKIHLWFKKQDYEKNLIDGESILERELKRLHLAFNDIKTLAKKFNYRNTKDFLAGLGAGDVRIGQVVHTLETLQKPHIQPDTIESLKKKPTKAPVSKGILIKGVGNLLTTIANCCKPVPGDAILGYITSGRGVSIHRRDCPNMLALENYKNERLIEVDWGQQPGTYPVDVLISAYDRHHLLRDITSILSNEHINLLAIHSMSNKEQHETEITISLEIPNLNQLSRILDKIQQLPNVINVHRKKTGV